MDDNEIKETDGGFEDEDEFDGELKGGDDLEADPLAEEVAEDDAE
jgi:hypothetical protein